jgi:hypothetical protein
MMGEPLFSQIVIVFCACIMAVCVGILFILVKNNAKDRMPPEAVPDSAAQADMAADGALIAVITAAVAAAMADDKKDAPVLFTVRRVRRISGGSAWQRAGREEQVYSRM